MTSGLSEESQRRRNVFPREALIQMLKAMRAQDKKEAQAAQAQDRVRLECICPFGDFGGITSDARNEKRRSLL